MLTLTNNSKGPECLFSNFLVLPYRAAKLKNYHNYQGKER